MFSSVNYLGIFLVHLAALYVVLLLWRQAPDIVQKIFLVVTFGAMGVYLFCDFLVLYGVRDGRELWGIEKVWPMRVVASSVAHGALLIYLARQWWIKTESCKEIKGRRV